MDTKDYGQTFGDDAEAMAVQTFVPRVPEPEEIPLRLRRRNLRSLQELEKYAKNRYEAVLIAAARARQLNAKKMALEERGLEDDAGELKRLKMTSFALNELLDGEIEVTRPEEGLEP
jgi:DNA-directed RNA polymerase omega subunit